ncbi:MAG TPA: hypothetical protein VFV61_09735, partial [Pyrinomonadaceae bacterium]|nr:hypothetical protein [Pyrinomonadaceae bacterium]
SLLDDLRSTKRARRFATAWSGATVRLAGAFRKRGEKPAAAEVPAEAQSEPDAERIRASVSGD